MKIAFCQMCVPICGRFAPNERGVVVRSVNLGQIYHKVGREDGGNEFSNTLQGGLPLLFLFKKVVGINLTSKGWDTLNKRKRLPYSADVENNKRLT